MEGASLKEALASFLAAAFFPSFTGQVELKQRKTNIISKNFIKAGFVYE